MIPGEKSKYDSVGSWVIDEKTAGEMSSNTKVQTKILKSCDRENKLKRDIRCQIKECEERISYLSCFRRKGDYFFVLSFYFNKKIFFPVEDSTTRPWSHRGKSRKRLQGPIVRGLQH